MRMDDSWLRKKTGRTFSDDVGDYFVWNNHSGYFRERGVFLKDVFVESLIDEEFLD
jgi:hypothetical protein